MWRHLLFVHLHFTASIQLAQHVPTPHLKIAFSGVAATPTPNPQITTTMSDDSSGQSCIVCDKEDAKYCARCKSTSYCSRACQKNDWQTHKLLCATFSTFATSERPTKEHYRAVLFDPDKKKPEFIWLLCKWHEDDGDRYQLPKSETITGHDVPPQTVPVQYNRRLERRLLNTICFTYRDTFLIDGSRPNKSIAAITSTQPGKYHDWRGPVMAYAKDGDELDPPACKDFDMADFRHAADYLLSYCYVPLLTQTHVQQVKGVRINCEGDIKMLNRPPFEEIELPITDSIFTEHDTSDIADRIGISILTRRCLPDPRWANGEHEIFKLSSPFNNQDATFLHRCLDTKAVSDPSKGSLGWGWCSQQWQNEVGSVVVIRKDKKPLLPLHMEALTTYCRKEALPIVSHSLGEYSSEEPVSKEHVLQLICRPMFIIFWYKFIEEKEDLTSPSPYDVDG
jgi:hypothetical protein